MSKMTSEQTGWAYLFSFGRADADILRDLGVLGKEALEGFSADHAGALRPSSTMRTGSNPHGSAQVSIETAGE